MGREDVFSGQTVIVTGGGTGIGRAIARRLAGAGARLVVASRRMEHLQPVVDEIESQGGEALAVPMDVRNPDDVERMVRLALARFGRVDHLVNNAAGNFICPAEQLTHNGWRAVLGIVLDGTF
ncbi:MAG: SDR family NAD(P)-dependent oxidoreductase, partial [Alicyclobacillus shizuokensis]|nr:SDR family NAD(P)-dependent oxidoreductase [Alicyclobacillus shizuokensis]